MQTSVDMGTVIAYIRLTHRPEDFAEYLNGAFPDLKFTGEIETDSVRTEGVVKCTTDLTEEKRKEVVNKLKLTSLHFVDKDNFIHN